MKKIVLFGDSLFNGFRHHRNTDLVRKNLQEKLGKDFNSMDELIAYRKEARDAKNWDIADKIRIALDEVNIVLKDSKEGTTWEVK